MSQADTKKSSRQEQQQNTQTVPHSSPYPQQFEDDTIDLYELWIPLWKNKWLIIGLTIVVALGAILYAQQLQRIYKAEALLLPPKEKDVQSVSIILAESTAEHQNQNSIGISPKAIFKKFKQNLKSRTLHKKFIQEKGLIEFLAPNRTTETRDEDIYQEFSKLIKIVEDKDENTTLSIELHNAEIAAKWVNDLTEFVNKETVGTLVEGLQNSIENQTRDIEYKIASKRQMAKRRREDQIIRYDEAAKVADKLGIKRRVDATNIIQNTQMNVDIATATTPLYYLGFEALMTEILILKNRVSDDPFISGLRDLQERLTLLRSLKFDEEKMKAVHIDQAAFPPKYSIKPNRRLIVSFATVVGLFSGIFLAFIKEFVHRQRKKYSE